MASFSWPASRQTVLDSNGELVPGAKLNFYVAGTTTPLVVYQDSALTTPHPNTIEASSAARWPRVYMPYTDYRERARTAAGTLLWDDDGIANPAPPSDGGGDTTPDASLVKTGFVKWDFGTGTLTGFVRANARTIGNAGSGATERANDDTEDLFIFLWDRLSDTICPVSGGRGGTGAADFAAGKALTLPDMRGRMPGGLDDMGNSAASRFSGLTFGQGDATTPGSNGGAATVTLTAGQLPANIPNSVSTSVSVSTVAPSGFAIEVTTGGQILYTAGGNSAPLSTGGVGSLASSASASSSATINPSGGGSHTNMPPFMLGTWYIRL